MCGAGLWATFPGLHSAQKKRPRQGTRAMRRKLLRLPPRSSKAEPGIRAPSIPDEGLFRETTPRDRINRRSHPCERRDVSVKQIFKSRRPKLAKIERGKLKSGGSFLRFPILLFRSSRGRSSRTASQKNHFVFGPRAERTRGSAARAYDLRPKPKGHVAVRRHNRSPQLNAVTTTAASVRRHQLRVKVSLA